MDIEGRQGPRFPKTGGPGWVIQGLALGGQAVGPSLCQDMEEPGKGFSGLGCRSWPHLGMTSLGVVGISGPGTTCSPPPGVWAEGSLVAPVAQPVQTLTVGTGMQEPADI